MKNRWMAGRSRLNQSDRGELDALLRPLLERINAYLNRWIRNKYKRLL
jgi:hypothetical protein